MTDPYSGLKDNAWCETAEIDARLDRGEIGEAGWQVEMAQVIVPAHLAAETPWEGSGKSGTATPHRFTYIRVGLEYVPRHRRRELVQRLLSCQRLTIGVFNEKGHARPTEELLRSWGYTVAGRSERANRKKPGMDYRVLWIDSRSD